MEVHDVPNVYDFGKKYDWSWKSIFFSRFSIVRAFLIEEQRIVAMVMKSKKPTGTTDATPAVPQAAGQKSK